MSTESLEWPDDGDAEAPSYAGFWVRVGAAIVDSLILLVLTGPLLHLIYGAAYWEGEQLVHGFWDVVIGYVLPALAVIAFWLVKSATPGKMVFRLIVCDAKSGLPLSPTQGVVRYLGYFFAMIPFGIGILWVAFDKRKQGWHDKLAGTVVVRRPPTSILDAYAASDID
ncbi:MAG: RDD family protein [Pseudomonadota bacterium]